MSETVDDVVIKFSDVKNKKIQPAGSSTQLGKKKYKKKTIKTLGGWEPGKPGALAICRYQTDGYCQAAMLLYWIKWRWQKKNKINRHGKEWIVSSAENWAKEAGLSTGEYKNIALPVLKRRGIIEVKTWKFSGIRQTWVHLKLDMLFNEFHEEHLFYEMRRQSEFKQIGIGMTNDYVKKRSNFPKKKKKGK